MQHDDLACRLVAIDHHQEDIYLLALVQPASHSSKTAAQTWLHATASSIQNLLPNTLHSMMQQPLSSQCPRALMESGSSLADSSHTHQHMDMDSCDAMSEDDWSHIDQRGSFSSLDSCLTDLSTSTTAAQKQAGTQATATGDSPDKCVHQAVGAQAVQQQQTSVQQPLHPAMSPHPPFKLARSRQQYLRDVAACQQALHDGESYEICLTTALVRSEAADALQLYRTLRKVNPAPYAAWMSFGENDLQICCSSPERFLKGGRGGVLEARPIKGTAPRSADPEKDRAAAIALAHSEKDQAENLMIVDLLRNDLGRVCQVCPAPW